MTSPQSPEVIPLASIAGGAINMQRTFPVLFSLAVAMKLDHTGTKKDLLPRILKKLKDDTVLAQSAEYMKFSVYRTPKTAQMATKNLKNSAERAAEDAEEEAKTVLPATGVHQKLSEAKASVDPLPQFAHLGGPTKDDKAMDNEDNNSDSSLLSEDETVEEERPVTPPPKNKEPKKMVMEPVTVVVVLNGSGKRELMVEAGGDAVPLTLEKEGINGAPSTYSTSLKALLTEAINSDTPMKANKKAKIYRAGLVDTAVHSLKLGSIEEILGEKQVGNLCLPAVDKYELQSLAGGLLMCDVHMVSEDGYTMAAAGASASAGIMPAPTGEQKPLVVAQQRASAAVINETREAAQHRFLCGVFDGRTTAWPRADVARVTRDRHTAVEDAVAKAFLAEQSGGGLDPDYNDANLPSHDLRGANLTKIQIQEAVGVLHAAAGDDRTNMKKMKKLVEYCPDATAWLENSAEGAEAARLARKFDELSVTAFVRRLERKQRKANAKSKAEGKKKRKAGSDLILTHWTRTKMTPRAPRKRNCRRRSQSVLESPARRGRSLYPLFRLHKTQRREPRQPVATGWYRSIGLLLDWAFHPERQDPHIWLDEGPEGEYAEQMCNDLEELYHFLGITGSAAGEGSFFPKPRDPLSSAAKQPHRVRLLGSDFQWVEADLFLAFCQSCNAEYHPDRITYHPPNQNNTRLQRPECDANYLRVSKHGIWVHRRIALAQENAVLNFHSG
ncbi:hypothetical protein B0H13DRAFT_1912716 [Mycena leptocephala]|nr:hypothetical protein B0H13DRAFT_1912716 [Mycena leptocephala]